MPASAASVRIPLTVRNFSGVSQPALPIWTGVALPRSAVKDAACLRLLDSSGAPVAAQFDVQARWTDGSVKWVLVSFFAAAQPAPAQYTVVADESIPSPEPAKPVSVRVDTNCWDVNTGVLKLRLNRHGFSGLSQAWLDVDGKGQFGQEDMIAPHAESAGLVAVDKDGQTYSSRFGQVNSIELERSGPVHAVVAFRGDLRRTDGGEALLNYVMRIHAFAGSSLVRVVLTVHNPRGAGRPEDGARWVLGQSGGVLLKALQYVQPVRLAEGHRRVSLSPEAGKLFDRIPLKAPMGVYQDSSGGENWFHRAHVNSRCEMPLSFRGYKAWYKDRQIDEGLRAKPWLDVSDMRWGVSACLGQFWQNSPKALWADEQGSLHVELWPERCADLHELQGGEQKTHEFWIYFRHRRGERREPRMPLDREVMPALLERPYAWPSAESLAKADVLDPLVPAEPGKFGKYEGIVAAALNGANNLWQDRERADEYGWRHFGDTPANNEIDQTQGAYAGIIACSHYNNEYDLGQGMLVQAARNLDADPARARQWCDLAMNALWHEADIDIYHTRQDIAHIYNGGTFTHTSHGVDAGTSTHRGAPLDEMWGKLDWPWAKGSTPEAGHLRNRGILSAYLLTGDRHLYDAAFDVTNLVDFKLTTNQFAQIDVPDRSNGNNLQILLDSYLLTYEQRYLELCRKVVANLTIEAVTRRFGADYLASAGWGTALYIKTLYRVIRLCAEQGERYEQAIAAHLGYARLIRKGYEQEGKWHSGPWSLLMNEVMMQAAELESDAAERATFIAAAKAAFHVNDAHVGPDGVGRYWNSKCTTMLLQGGGLYMRHAIATRDADAK